MRGKFLSLREEDFVTAAELAGAGQMRIIFRHMLPSFLSHIIATVSLAVPALFIINADGSVLRQVTPFGLLLAHELASAAWEPDGEHLITARARKPVAARPS